MRQEPEMDLGMAPVPSWVDERAHQLTCTKVDFYIFKSPNLLWRYSSLSIDKIATRVTYKTNFQSSFNFKHIFSYVNILRQNPSL